MNYCAIRVRPLPGNPMMPLWLHEDGEPGWAWVRWGSDEGEFFYAGNTLSPNWEEETGEIFFAATFAEDRAADAYEELLGEDGGELWEIMIWEEGAEEEGAL